MIKGSDGSRVPLRGRTMGRYWRQPYIFVNPPTPEKTTTKMKQECIPVGYVPPAGYHIGGLPHRDPLDRDLAGQRPPGQRPPPEQNDTQV